jgi:lipoyl-dependent peroxiredoxin
VISEVADSQRGPFWTLEHHSPASAFGLRGRRLGLALSCIGRGDPVKTLYIASVVSIGGRHGAIRSDDGLLHTLISQPKAMGGRGDAPNPEQLFAGGYAACFGSAVVHAAKLAGCELRDEDVQVEAKVGICATGRNRFSLSVALEVTIKDIGLRAAERIVEAAHWICPYSSALRGNIDVTVTVQTR